MKIFAIIAITLLFCFSLPIFAEETATMKGQPNQTTRIDTMKNENSKEYLVVYYSRTGNTRKVAEAIAGELKCDIEEIIDLKDRSGALGYMKSGKDATLKNLTEIRDIEKNPGDYATIIIGTPVWAWTMSTAVRTYITRFSDRFKSVAFFCTMGGSGDKGTFEAMEELCGKHPIMTLAILQSEIEKDSYRDKVKYFAGKILKNKQGDSDGR